MGEKIFCGIVIAAVLALSLYNLLIAVLYNILIHIYGI